MHLLSTAAASDDWLNSFSSAGADLQGASTIALLNVTVIFVQLAGHLATTCGASDFTAGLYSTRRGCPFHLLVLDSAFASGVDSVSSTLPRSGVHTAKRRLSDGSGFSVVLKYEIFSPTRAPKSKRLHCAVRPSAQHRFLRQRPLEAELLGRFSSHVMCAFTRQALQELR